MASDPFAHARPNWSLHPSANGPHDGGQGSLTPPLAATAPVLKCYEEAVQEPRVECCNLDSLYSQAQLDDTDRYDARILREDFCSSAIIATTWLGLDKRNRSQGVDIDFEALSDTRQRLGRQKVRLLQSPNFARQAGRSLQGTTVEVHFGDDEASSKANSANGGVIASNGSPTRASGTWAPGAATERFDRKRAKKLQKKAKKEAGKSAVGPPMPSHGSLSGGGSVCGPTAQEASRMTLLHSDVLDLPVPAVGEEASSGTSALEPPDIIASLNYAMAYFHDRKTLLAYLHMALRTLRPKTGVFITDMFGGPSTGEIYPDQDDVWTRFRDEAGFGRGGGDGRGQTVLTADRTKAGAALALGGSESSAQLNSIGTKSRSSRRPTSTGGVAAEAQGTESQRVLEVMGAPRAEDVGTRAEWPRGKLKMVRAGETHGGFEYWREDGPVDWMTNRFRMSLSFRFGDGSWLRDVFSYDFRVWSLKELTEAMEEVGFVRVKVFALPRNAVDDEASDSEASLSCPSSPMLDGIGLGDGDAEVDTGLEGMAALMLKTEKEERNKTFYRGLERGEKLFANRSFGTYIVACAP
ncbi:hypothetical protein ACQY0O_007975 [Thecaphora frezii]